MKELLYQYNPWWEDDFKLHSVVPRRRYTKLLRKNLNNRSIIFLTGSRRVGKTTLLKLIIKELLDRKIDRKNILYFSADDYLLRGRNLFDILDEYRKIHKITLDEKIYAFFDEISYKEDFHQQLKNLYDRYQIKIFASSSSSSLLKEKRAFLTGRSITIEVSPLNFHEYLQFKNIEIKQRDGILNDTYFREFLSTGGLPENVLNPNREYLMNLVDDIIQKDITAYHGLKNHQLLRDYFILLMERSGKQISINKIANILNISPDTSRRYLAYFEDTYLIHLMGRWGNTNEKILSPKKVYAGDIGIKYLFQGDKDIGSYFENYLYLELRNRKEWYYLYEDGIEIDFISSDGILIESKYYSSLTDKQKELFENYQAENKFVIDSPDKLYLIDEI